MNRLFVYGIFLDESARFAYGMSNPQYQTVKDYVTIGNGIVAAYKIPNYGFCLSGLVVNVDPDYWGRIDGLESGYNRIKVNTTDGEEVWIYAGGSSV